MLRICAYCKNVKELKLITYIAMWHDNNTYVYHIATYCKKLVNTYVYTYVYMCMYVSTGMHACTYIMFSTKFVW